jgi:hypothetical protein
MGVGVAGAAPGLCGAAGAFVVAFGRVFDISVSPLGVFEPSA